MPLSEIVSQLEAFADQEDCFSRHSHEQANAQQEAKKKNQDSLGDGEQRRQLEHMPSVARRVRLALVSVTFRNI